VVFVVFAACHVAITALAADETVMLIPKVIEVMVRIHNTRLLTSPSFYTMAPTACPSAVCLSL
jgi:hypothetical protein